MQQAHKTSDFDHTQYRILKLGKRMGIKYIIQRVKAMLCGNKKKAKFIGTIKFFDKKKRFGFIVCDQYEYFFHAAATKPRDFKLLQDGVSVKFNVVPGKKGPQADNIEIVSSK